MPTIVDSSSIQLRPRGSTRVSQFDELLPVIAKLKKGKAVLVAGSMEEDELKAFQSQVCAWLRKRRDQGMVPSSPKLSVSRDVKNQLWITATGSK